MKMESEMKNLSLLTKLFTMAFLGLGLALFGCPPDSESDDDDDAVGDDDDVVGDDDDVVGDDDDVVGDDDDVVGDDDDTGGTTNEFEYVFDVILTTQVENGTCAYCLNLEDGGPYNMSYDADYMFDYYGTLYGPYALIIYGGMIWYYVSSDANDHIEFYYDYGTYANQDGFWDVTGAGAAMTGESITDEDNGFHLVQSSAGTG